MIYRPNAQNIIRAESEAHWPDPVTIIDLVTHWPSSNSDRLYVKNEAGLKLEIFVIFIESYKLIQWMHGMSPSHSHFLSVLPSAKFFLSRQEFFPRVFNFLMNQLLPTSIEWVIVFILLVTWRIFVCKCLS